MHKLFWRVFAWYLGATLAILVAGIVIFRLTDSASSGTSLSAYFEKTVSNQAEAAAMAWRNGGAAALRAEFAMTSRPRFLVEESGRDLAGNPVNGELTELIRRARGTDAFEYASVGRDRFVARRVMAGGRPLVFVRPVPQQPMFPLIGGPLPMWARLGLGIFTALVMCSLFAAYVTSPLLKLRAAARDFAAGNLSARVGRSKPFHRGDEFSELAADFDNMATQIQNLMLAQKRILGDISHELRSPLTRLQIALEMARRKAGPEAQENLDRIEQEAERMNSLIGQMLQTARTEQMQPGKRRLFDLALLVEEVAADANFEAVANGKAVTLKKAEMSVVHADRELVRSAIENVVRNAIRYTPPGSDVRIELERGEGQAHITVRDEGPGVPEEALTKLFDPFYRVNAARDRDSGGVGLGLAITRQVVTAHGGTVEARNRQGGGMELELNVPLKTPDLGHGAIRFRD